MKMNEIYMYKVVEVGGNMALNSGKIRNDTTVHNLIRK